MALDFPSNPIDGQIYGSYTWSSSRGVWQAREESAATAITSPIAPATANPGDIWVNTSTGIAFVYYDDGNSSQWMELLSSAVPNTAETMPVASIIQTARISAPTGWLLCQGQSLLVADYPALHAAIGYTYGGTGANFLLPDLRGRVPVGKSDSGTFVDLNASGGAEVVTLTNTQIPAHSHPNTLGGTTTFATSAHTHTSGGLTAAIGAVNGNIGAVGYVASNNFNGGPSTATYTVSGGGASGGSFNHYTNVYGTTAAASASGTVSLTNANNTGGGEAHNNLQPYIVLNYMIKV